MHPPNTLTASAPLVLRSGICIFEIWRSCEICNTNVAYQLALKKLCYIKKVLRTIYLYPDGTYNNLDIETA